MIRTSSELEQEFLQQLEGRTGKTLTEWMSVLQESNRQSRRDLLTFMMATYAWSHLQAQLLVGIFLNGGKPVYRTN